MNTDVLFETEELAFKVYPLLKNSGLINDIRFFISPVRPRELKSSRYMTLLPFCLRSEYEGRLKGSLDKEKPERVLIRNTEELGFLKDIGFKGDIYADASLYSFNRESREVYQDLGVSEDTVPYELNCHEMKERGVKGSSVLIYGRIPLMVSAQCTYKTSSGRCRKEDKGFEGMLTDRKKVRFPYRAECRYCTNVIYNSVPLSLFKEIDEIERLRPEALRLMFTFEKAETAAAIIKAYLGRDTEELNRLIPEYTKGHFRKGVE